MTCADVVRHRSLVQSAFDEEKVWADMHELAIILHCRQRHMSSMTLTIIPADVSACHC